MTVSEHLRGLKGPGTVGTFWNVLEISTKMEPAWSQVAWIAIEEVRREPGRSDEGTRGIPFGAEGLTLIALMIRIAEHGRRQGRMENEEYEINWASKKPCAADNTTLFVGSKKILHVPTGEFGHLPVSLLGSAIWVYVSPVFCPHPRGRASNSVQAVVCYFWVRPHPCSRRLGIDKLRRWVKHFFAIAEQELGWRHASVKSFWNRTVRLKPPAADGSEAERQERGGEQMENAAQKYRIKIISWIYKCIPNFVAIVLTRSFTIAFNWLLRVAITVCASLGFTLVGECMMGANKQTNNGMRNKNQF